MKLFTSTTITPKHTRRIFSQKVFASHMYTLLLLLMMFGLVVGSSRAATSATEAPGKPAKVVLPGEALYRQGVDLEELAKKDSSKYVSVADKYRAAAELNHPRAQFNLAGLLFEGKRGVPQDKGKAMELFTAAGTNGHVRAQFNLGTLYERGTAVDQDETLARTWYERAAAGGFPRAKSHLALMLEEGRGGPADIAAAVGLYQSALEGVKPGEEDPLVLTNLSRLYMLGLGGLPKDPSKATELLATAAEKGYAAAQFNLGIIQEHKAEIAEKAQDLDAAQGLYQDARINFMSAARQEYDKAYYFIATMLEDGKGGSKDPEKAKRYYRQAAAVKAGTNYTPLQLAAKEGRLEAIKDMLKFGADLTATNRDGMSALKLAIKYGHEEVMNFIQDALEDLQAKERLSQEEDLKRRQGEVDAASPRQVDAIREMQAQLALLMEKHKAQEAIELERTHIRSQESLRPFYRHFMMKMEEFFLAYKVLNTGYVSRNGNTVDTIASGISLVGGMIPLPGASAIASGIGWAIGKANERYESKKITLVSNLIENLSTMEKEVELSSRVLTKMYATQLQELDKTGSVTLAESAVARLIEYVRADKANDEEPLSEQLLHAIATFNPTSRFFSSERNIKTKNTTKEPWTDRGIFQLSGIETPAGERYVSDTTKADTYYYRKASEGNVARLGFFKAVDLSQVKGYTPRPDGSMEEVDGYTLIGRRIHTTESLSRAQRDAQTTIGSASAATPAPVPLTPPTSPSQLLGGVSRPSTPPNSASPTGSSKDGAGSRPAQATQHTTNPSISVSPVVVMVSPTPTPKAKGCCEGSCSVQ